MLQAVTWSKQVFYYDPIFQPAKRSSCLHVFPDGHHRNPYKSSTYLWLCAEFWFFSAVVRVTIRLGMCTARCGSHTKFMRVSWFETVSDGKIIQQSHNQSSITISEPIGDSESHRPGWQPSLNVTKKITRSSVNAKKIVVKIALGVKIIS